MSLSNVDPRQLVVISYNTAPILSNGPRKRQEIINFAFTQRRCNPADTDHPKIRSEDILVKPHKSVIDKNTEGYNIADFSSAKTLPDVLKELKIKWAGKIAALWNQQEINFMQEACSYGFLNNPLPPQILNISAMLTVYYDFPQYPTLESACRVVLNRSLPESLMPLERSKLLLEIISEL